MHFYSYKQWVLLIVAINTGFQRIMSVISMDAKTEL